MIVCFQFENIHEEESFLFLTIVKIKLLTSYKLFNVACRRRYSFEIVSLERQFHKANGFANDERITRGWRAKREAKLGRKYTERRGKVPMTKSTRVGCIRPRSVRPEAA